MENSATLTKRKRKASSAQPVNALDHGQAIGSRVPRSKRRGQIQERSRSQDSQRPALSLSASDDTESTPSSSPSRRRSSSPVLPNRHYVDLLNDMILEARNTENRDVVAGSFSRSDSRRGLQIGISCWTADEMSRFFRGVERSSPLDLARISLLVGSKSETEVHQLLLLMHDIIDTDPSRYWFKAHPVPTAVEIDPECCDALEEAADQVLEWQSSVETSDEYAAHGDCWLVDEKIAAKLEDLIRGTERDALGVHVEQSATLCPQSLNDLIPAAVLLRLPLWLELSETVFMNGPAPVVDHDEAPDSDTLIHKEHASQYKPAMFATAASDFYRLAIDITKKLVCATLFQANSRIRATDVRDDRAPRREVSADDVATALDILGMPHDSLAFWARTARKNQLNVFDYNSRIPLYGRDITRVERHGGLGSPMSYTAVERALGLVYSSSDTAGRVKGANEHRQSADEDDRDARGSSAPSGAEDEAPHNLSPPASPSSSESDDDDDRSSPATAAEQTRLRAILADHSPPPPASPGTDAGRPRLRRPDSPPRWRDNVAPVAEWERHGHLPAPPRVQVDPALAAAVHRKWQRGQARSASSSRSRSRADSRGRTPGAGRGRTSSASRGSSRGRTPARGRGRSRSEGASRAGAEDEMYTSAEDRADDGADSDTDDEGSEGRMSRTSPRPRRASRGKTPAYGYVAPSIEDADENAAMDVDSGAPIYALPGSEDEDDYVPE